MDTKVKHVAMACTLGSDQERLSFPEVVMQLAAAGMERYYADLVRAEKTYYLPSGASVTVPCAGLDIAPAIAFSAEDVAAAVRAIQANTIGYHEFCRRIAAAGCVSYIVSLLGRRAVYSGRTGEAYVEPFPGAA